jgi:hypothetical protein
MRVALVAVVTVAVVAAAVPVAVANGDDVDRLDSPASNGDLAGTHGDHVVVRPQVSSDGRVVVETVSTLAPSFVVLRTDDDGQPGAPVGHAAVTGGAELTSVPVDIDDQTWEFWAGNRTLWAVIHRDDGDGEFDPATDESVARRSFSGKTSFTLRRSQSGEARVLARQFEPQVVRDGRITVRRVDLPTRGHLVATSRDGSQILGTRALDAGRHANVTVELDESFVAEQQHQFRVRLVAYRDDGDGEFGDLDAPVMAGGERVASELVVDVPDDDTATGDGSSPQMASPTASPTPPGDETQSSTAPGQPQRTTTAAETSETGAGFGASVALGAILLAVLCVLALTTYHRRK